MKTPIYLDFNATTPVHAEVLDAMLPYFTKKFGNAASKSHTFGLSADKVVEQSRTQVANCINSSSQEIIFTSGSTEAINLAIKGVAETYGAKGKHIITAKTEHKAVLDTCKYLEQNGYSLTYLNVNANGLIDIEELHDAISDQTILVCIMLANNETGVLQPIKEIAAIVHENNSILMSDATQCIGKLKMDVQDLGIDLMCLSAHKFYGPKGVGALYIRRKNPRVTLTAQIHGGGHENNLRSGTLNVPAIAGLGKACELSNVFTEWQQTKIKELRNYFENRIKSEIKSIKINCEESNRLPNTSNIQFAIKSASIIKKMMDIAVSTGSACTSAKPEPSHVLLAMGLSEVDANKCIRFSLGISSTKEEIDYTIEKIKNIITEHSVLTS